MGYLAFYLLTLGVALLLVALGVKWAASSISQAREYLADACAAQWTRNPGALAAALNEISGGVALQPTRTMAVSPLLIHAAKASAEEGWGWRLFAFLLRSHPEIEERIERLRSMAPLGGADWGIKPAKRGFLKAVQRVAAALMPLGATAAAVALVAGYVSLTSALRGGKPPAPKPQVVPQVPAVVFGRVTETMVRLREGPGTNTRILAGLPKGTRVRIVQSQGDWYAVEVESSRQRGWVARRLIALEGKEAP
ncbi:MAG: SH3 domain-containing protein [Thermoanaerobaculum sp.]